MLEKTLERLGRDSLDLYYLHVPYSPLTVGAWIRAQASAGKAGTIWAVGIRNRNVAQMRKAADELGRDDIPLAANQAQYTLLHRKPETDGVLDACRQMDVALVAHRPIGGGAPSPGSPKRSGRSAGRGGDWAGDDVPALKTPVRCQTPSSAPPAKAAGTLASRLRSCRSEERLCDRRRDGAVTTSARSLDPQK